MSSRTKRHSKNEARLLALLVSERDPSETSELHNLCASVDWNNVAQLAQRNGVSGLISPRVAELRETGLIPEPCARLIESNAMTVAASSLAIDIQLKRLFALAAEHEIPLIVLKGAAVANLLYPRPHARQAGDIDLLCKEEDYTRFFDVLVEAGYVTDGERELPSACSTLETAFEQKFHPPDSRILIELHLDSIKLGIKPANATSIWDRAIPVSVGDSTVQSLGPQDLAFMLSVHLHRHGFDRLAWFKDIDLLIRKYGATIDWDAVVEDARREGATASLWLTFDALEKLLGTPVPEGLLEKVRPSFIPRIIARLIWTRKKIYTLESHTRRRAVQFSTGESWRGKLPSLLLIGRRREKLSVMAHHFKLKLTGK